MNYATPITGATSNEMFVALATVWRTMILMGEEALVADALKAMTPEDRTRFRDAIRPSAQAGWLWGDATKTSWWNAANMQADREKKLVAQLSNKL